ncbi:MAG: UrcA family protein [Novosphingobium sp.]|jgi:UrcA family protein
MTIKTNTIALAAAALAALAFSSTAHAQAETSQREVNLSGYDLNNPEGLKKVHQRIHSAARSVCEMRESDGLGNSMLKRQCYEKAVTIAQAQVQARIAALNSKNTPAVALDSTIKIGGAKR